MNYIDQRDLENQVYEEKQNVFSFKKFNLGLSLTFLYQEFVFLLWVQLSFIFNICGTYINLWFCGVYTNIFFCMILTLYYIKCRNVNKIFECLLLFFNFVWAGAGLYFQQSTEWNDLPECKNNPLLKPTVIFYILQNIIFTWFISKNRN
jgi:magnesium-transporting ATPase (P-type)